MKTISLFAFVALLLTFAFCARAEGAERAKKPTVCLSYAIAKTDKANDDAVAICYDSKKPALFYLFREAEIPKADGTGPMKVLVGWR